MRLILLFVATLLATTKILMAQEAVEAQEWLTKTIIEYFDQPSSHFQEITTQQYAEYKQDAICVVYDCNNSITPEQFKVKWDGIYETKFAGIGEGFLIDQQDWGKIVVLKCEIVSQPKPGIFILHTIISDTMFELTHCKEIKVVRTEIGFKIDDVKDLNKTQ